MRKYIRVLIVGSDSSVKGGITSVIDRFLNYNWNGIKVELLPTYIEGNSIKKIVFFLKGVLKYIKRLIKNDFDIAHIHMSYKGSFFRKYLIIKLSKLFKKKTILHLHGSEFEVFYNNSNSFIKKMIRSTLESVDSVIVLGKKWSEVVRKIAPKANINIFNNAVDVPEHKVKWSDEKINVLFLGVLIKRKGIFDLIEAIRVLHEAGVVKEKNLNFIIGGSGPEEENLKSKIIEYNLDYCIEMVGWTSGELKENLLKKSQIFVLPSYNEGLPMAILEAMSYGIPVIATDVGSIAEVVKNNETGFLINSGEVNDIAKSIICISKNEYLWNEKSKKCSQIIAKRFNEEVYFKGINDLYSKIMIDV